jgi:CheY-like chemotaxis protein
VANLLIIDDDPAVTLTLSRMLEHQGHAVACVETAEAALERATSSAPDAIILDMRMPGMGGLEFLRRLRADARLRALPVGVITGDYFINDQVMRELSTLGAKVKYKPVWLADLTELTNALLESRPESS